MKIPFLVFLSFFIFCGCASFNTIKYINDSSLPATNPDNIQIIPVQFSQSIPKENIILGEIRCSHAPASNINNLYKRLRKEAAKLGANAIVVVSSSNFSGVYNAPGTSTTSGSAYAFSSKGNINVQGNSQTTYYPGMSIPIYHGEITAIALKFKEQ